MVNDIDLSKLSNEELQLLRSLLLSDSKKSSKRKKQTQQEDKLPLHYVEVSIMRRYECVCGYVEVAGKSEWKFSDDDSPQVRIENRRVIRCGHCHEMLQSKTREELMKVIERLQHAHSIPFDKNGFKTAVIGGF